MGKIIKLKMKTIAILALLGNVSAIKFLGDEAPVWYDSKLMKDAKQMSEGDEKFGRFLAFEKNRKAGLDDYTRSGPIQFVDRNEEENKKQEQPKKVVTEAPPAVAPQAVPAQEKKQVFYFDGEEMIKRDAMVQMVQLKDDN